MEKDVKLPLDEIVLKEGEALMVLGGNAPANGSVTDGGCGCGCGCSEGKDCGCGCYSGAGCDCKSGAGCGCSCALPTVNTEDP